MTRILHSYPCTRAILAAAGLTVVAIKAVEMLMEMLPW